jgi:16S rRNA C967 or C1407 C5-methylase (RsmB/RsmF family)
MTLPEDFVRMMHEQYGADTADSLCHALCDTEPEVSIRLNPRKGKTLSIENLDVEACPWCPDAYYLHERPAFTFDPLLHAGAYYVQEASSMYVSQLLRHHFPISGPSSALDLCAAPGGKSTLLASLLPSGSILVSNEPMPKRAQVLAENMQKWTRTAEGEYPVRSVVTQNYPTDFVEFTGSFDLLLTDVPCSGEGMFRKDEVAVQDWSLQNVDLCWRRQREILQGIWHVLKPGGLLIYSTCTFNHFEDEDNVRWICENLGGMLLEERHFLPGRDRGEGFYCAAIQSVPRDEEQLPSLGISSDELKSLEAKLRTLHVLPQAFSVEPDMPRIELTYSQALSYLRREAVRVPAPRGMVLLCYKGYVLGPGKCVGNRINNLYPEQWRIRTTYTTPFSLGEL